MAGIRFVRSQPWLVLGMIVAVGAAAAVFSVAVLEALGVVRVFAVVRTHANGGTGADHMFGIQSPSHALSVVHDRAFLLLLAGFSIWILRLARRTAGYFIGGWRTIGLLIPPMTVAVLAGALHAATEGVVPDERRRSVHRVISAWRAAAIIAILLDWMVRPGWSTLGGQWALGRGWSMPMGVLGAAAVVVGFGLGAALTWAWQTMTPPETRRLERRLAELPFA